MITVLQAPKKVSASRNPIGFRVSADAGWAAFTSYSIKCVIKKETTYQGGTYTEILQLEETPDSLGIVEFDFHRYLEGLVSLDAPSALVPDAMRVIEAQNWRYSVVLEEYQNGTKVTSQFYDDYHVVLAGHWIGRTYDDWVNDRKFLTHQPRGKQVTSTQLEWLHFFIPLNSDPTSVTLKVDITFTNGTKSTYVPSGFTLTATAGELIEIPAGYGQLDLGSQGSVKSWQVYLVANGGSLAGEIFTELMTFTLSDCKCTPRDRWFLFDSSMGGWNVLHAHGRAAMSIDATGQLVSGSTSLSTTKTDHQQYYRNTKIQGQYEQAVGYVPIAEARWLKDLALAQSAYRIGESDAANTSGEGELIPINIDRGTMKILEDGEIASISFSYKDAMVHHGL